MRNANTGAMSHPSGSSVHTGAVVLAASAALALLYRATKLRWANTSPEAPPRRHIRAAAKDVPGDAPAPIVLIMLSGKRCSGKDALGDLLRTWLPRGGGSGGSGGSDGGDGEDGEDGGATRPRTGSGPAFYAGHTATDGGRLCRPFDYLRVAFADGCKEGFAEAAGLDAARLANDREYKEEHRSDMTAWCAKRRA